MREKVLGKSIEQQFRHVWNKALIQKFYSTKQIHDLLRLVIKNDDTHEQLETGERVIASFPIGDDGYQVYFMVVNFPKEKKEVPEAISKLIGLVNKEFGIYKKIEQLGKENQLIHIDDVTGLYNQRKLHHDLEQAINKYAKYGEEFSMLFIDVDHFKSVNDGHGHLVGTFLLSEVARLLRLTLRDEDLIYRYGGDEYVIILPNSNLDIGRRVGERILKAVKTQEFQIKEDQKLKLSVSIGVASYPNNARTREDILSMADEMMYKAKAGGRGKVCVSGIEPQSPVKKAQ